MKNLFLFIKWLLGIKEKSITFDRLTEEIGAIICKQKNWEKTNKIFEELQFILHTYKGGYFELAQLICDKYKLDKDANVKYFATCIYNFRIGAL